MLSSTDGSRGDVEPMADHAVVVAGGDPTGLMLAGELALAGSTLPLSSGAPVRTSLARAQAVCIHAPSRFLISAESLIGFFRRGRWRSSPGFLWTSATFPPGSSTGLGLWQNV